MFYDFTVVHGYIYYIYIYIAGYQHSYRHRIENVGTYLLLMSTALINYSGKLSPDRKTSVFELSTKIINKLRYTILYRA